MLGHVHNGHPRNLPDAIPQILVVGRHNVALVLRHPIRDTVIRVRALVQTRQPFEPWILDDPQGHLVLVAQLLQLGQDTVRDIGDALGVQAVHHIHEDVQFALDAEIDEIRVHQDMVRRSQLRVVLEEQRRAHLRGIVDLQLVRVNLGLLLGGDLEGGELRNCWYVAVMLIPYLVRLL